MTISESQENTAENLGSPFLPEGHKDVPLDNLRPKLDKTENH